MSDPWSALGPEVTLGPEGLGLEAQREGGRSVVICRHCMATNREIPELTADQEQWLADDLELRGRARGLAVKLQLDEGDVYHFLKNLRRPPVERLRRGLAHGRARRRIP